VRPSITFTTGDLDVAASSVGRLVDKSVFVGEQSGCVAGFGQ
jgi:hypothetical protein